MAATAVCGTVYQTLHRLRGMQLATRLGLSREGIMAEHPIRDPKRPEERRESHPDGGASRAGQAPGGERVTSRSADPGQSSYGGFRNEGDAAQGKGHQPGTGPQGGTGGDGGGSDAKSPTDATRPTDATVPARAEGPAAAKGDDAADPPDDPSKRGHEVRSPGPGGGPSDAGR
jgi:hypothetical protein